MKFTFQTREWETKTNLYFNSYTTGNYDVWADNIRDAQSKVKEILRRKNLESWIIAKTFFVPKKT